MCSRHQHVRARPMVCHASPIVMWGFFLLVFPALVMVRGSFVAAQTTSLAGTAGSQESPPLTVAQEQARQLATALTGEREAMVVAEKTLPLAVIADQTMRLGKRVVIPLFTLLGVEVQLVSGEQTFASPVDEASATAPGDAGRPVFLPASQAAVAVEVRGEPPPGTGQ